METFSNKQNIIWESKASKHNVALEGKTSNAHINKEGVECHKACGSSNHILHAGVSSNKSLTSILGVGKDVASNDFFNSAPTDLDEMNATQVSHPANNIHYISNRSLDGVEVTNMTLRWKRVLLITML